MHEKSLPYLYGDSKYATCTLIGSQKNLETFKPESLTNFYHTWYRPDLQAVIVVGDIDVDQIEAKIKESMYIATSVVFGVNEKGIDQKYLTALILPDQDAIENYANENGIKFNSFEELCAMEAIQKFIEQIVFEEVSAKNGFKSYERINKIALITKPFEIGVELSAKQEMMRYRVAELYKDKLAMLYKE